MQETPNQTLAGIIVEVEAYQGKTDEAAHTYRGKTKRNEIMFNEGGYLYVYFTYGVHHCANVVAGKENEGDAILIRGIEPIEGISAMCCKRFSKNTCLEKDKINLTNGPGKICQAFNINREQNGIDLTEDKIYLLNNASVDKNSIVATTRIGIKKSVDLPWRFYLKDNIYVSKK